MKREIRLTADGSPTLYVPELDETYHSMHGSVQEAKHVFIANGLSYLFSQKEQLSILEVGFGTGLNALLSARFALENKLAIQYTGMEAFPVEERIWSELSYFQTPLEMDLYQKLMKTEWDVPHVLHSYFSLSKLEAKIQEWQSDEKFDLIYFDAFGPNAQADMWKLSIFENLYAVLNQGGVLVTYCAQGQFKRDLKSVGFSIEALPGPPGKREMTRATKN
jgi:tRNA U34 5-methylaminomethyl-2-thiouridine-forming methyltransferase MnmC